MGQHRTLRRSNMKRLFVLAVAAALVMTMSTMANNSQLPARTNQLNRPYVGYNSFNDSRIRRQLNLSQDQLRQLRALNNGWRKQLQRFRRGAGNNLNTVDQTQWNQIWQQYQEMVSDVLSGQQQQAWAQLIAQSYAFSPNFNVARTSTAARSSAPNARAGMASTGQTSTTGP